jgi:hypothetical protein
MRVCCNFVQLVAVVCCFIFPVALRAETGKFVSKRSEQHGISALEVQSKIIIYDNNDTTPDFIEITIEGKRNDNGDYFRLFHNDGNSYSEPLKLDVEGSPDLSNNSDFRIGTGIVKIKFNTKDLKNVNNKKDIIITLAKKANNKEIVEKCKSNWPCLNIKIPVYNYKRDVVCTIKSVLKSTTVECFMVIENTKDSNDHENKESISIGVDQIYIDSLGSGLFLKRGEDVSKINVSGVELHKIKFDDFLVPGGIRLSGDFYIAYGASKDKFSSLPLSTLPARSSSDVPRRPVPISRPGDASSRTEGRSQQYFITTGNMNVRSTPNKGDNILYTIGTEVRVLELDNNGNWKKIRFTSRNLRNEKIVNGEGWVDSSALIRR